jgi:hypothetical protein
LASSTLNFSRFSQRFLLLHTFEYCEGITPIPAFPMATAFLSYAPHVPPIFFLANQLWHILKDKNAMAAIVTFPNVIDACRHFYPLRDE